MYNVNCLKYEKIYVPQSKLQKCVSTSTAEAELNAVVEANKEAVHLVNLLRESDLEIQQPVTVFV